MENFADCYELLANAFPKTELRTNAEQQKLLTNKYYRLIEYRAEDKLQAVMCLWDFKNFIYLEHLAVAPEVRGQGIGKHIIEQLIAEKKFIVLEVDPPLNEIARRRVVFYQRLGFEINEFFYLQPPLRPENSSIELKLMTYG
ncbi:MAG: GNAT family N-acetyltransferase, partial [Clostridia bacterium]